MSKIILWENPTEISEKKNPANSTWNSYLSRRIEKFSSRQSFINLHNFPNIISSICNVHGSTMIGAVFCHSG